MNDLGRRITEASAGNVKRLQQVNAPNPVAAPAVVIDRFGGPDVLDVRSVAVREPGPGEVLVRTWCATVNPTDVLLRSGAHAQAVESLAGPWTPGMELSGIVERVGAGVDQFCPGHPVVGLVDPRRRDGGAQASLVCVPATWLSRAPAGISPEAAATLPMNGATALMVLESLGLPRGSSLLVTGAAGGLGGYVVELAIRAGIRVLALCRAEDAEVLRRLGAEPITDADGLASRVREHAPGGTDGLVDAALIGPTARAVVRPGGVVVHVRRAEPLEDGRRDAAVSVLTRLGDTALLRRVLELAEEGTLTPRVNRVLPVTEVAEAHRLVEAGRIRGRVVLDFRQMTTERPA